METSPLKLSLGKQSFFELGGEARGDWAAVFADCCFLDRKVGVCQNSTLTWGWGMV